MAKKFTYKELVLSLSQHLRAGGTSTFRPVVIIERPIGSVWLENGCPIPDVLSLKPSYTRGNITIYEVKASRGDFGGDVREGKWRKYWEMCNRFLFAVPAGLVKKDDVLEGAGLITLSDKGNWSVIKAGQVHDGELNEDQLLSLLFARQEENRLVRDLADTVANQSNWQLETTAVQMSDTLRKQIHSLAAREQFWAEEKKAVEARLMMIAEALGIDKLPHQMTTYTIEQALRKRTDTEGLQRGLQLLERVSAYLNGTGHTH